MWLRAVFLSSKFASLPREAFVAAGGGVCGCPLTGGRTESKENFSLPGKSLVDVRFRFAKVSEAGV